MVAVLVNSVAVLVGSFIGIFFKKGISEKLQNAIIKAMGLITLLVAVQSAIKSEDTLCVIICLVLGTLLGEIIRIDDGLNNAGDYIKVKVFKGKDGSTSRFTEGFVITSIQFCVGSMTILGSMQAGINHDYSIIFTKSVMDFVTSIVFGAAFGYGVTCTALFVLVFQGALTLAASGLSGILTDNIVVEMTAVGGVILIGMGFNILELGKTPIKVANMLPAIFLPPLYIGIVSMF